METEDKKTTLEGIYSKMVGATEVDHELEPLTWPSLKTKWQEKSIGTNYLNQESKKIANLYQLLPQELRDYLQEGVINFNQFLTDWNQDRRDTNVLGLGPIDAVTGVEWGIDQVGDLLTTITGIDNRYFDLTLGNISKGAIANRMLKRINTLKKYNASKGILKRLEAAQEAGDTFEMNKILKEMEILDADLINKNNIVTGIENKLNGGSTNPKYILRPEHGIRDKASKGIYKELSDQGLLEEAENILTGIDEYVSTSGYGRPGWSMNRPTTGYTRQRTVPYIRKDGVASEVAFRWSKTKGTYVPYDLLRKRERVIRRVSWNVNRSSNAAKYADKLYATAKEKNDAIKSALDKLRQDNPEYFWKIMGENYDTTKGIVYIEHIHAKKSPFWNKPRNFKPRDTANLVVVSGPEFGTLKTAIEQILYNKKGNTLYVDFDKTRRVMILRNSDGERIGDISSITNTRNAQQAINAARRGYTIPKGREGDWQEVLHADPDIPPHMNLLDDIEGDVDPRFDGPFRDLGPYEQFNPRNPKLK